MIEKNIERYRMRKQLSRNELTRLTGVRKNSPYNPEELLHIANVLDIPYAYLFEVR